MHSHSGWSPVFNAVFVGTAVLLMAISIHPQPQPVKNALRLLASAAGAPSVSVESRTVAPDIDSIFPERSKSERGYTKMRLVSAERLGGQVVDAFLAHSAKQNLLADKVGLEFSEPVARIQMPHLTVSEEPQFVSQPVQEESRDFEFNGRETTNRNSDLVYGNDAIGSTSPYQNVSSTRIVEEESASVDIVSEQLVVEEADIPIQDPAPPEVLLDPPSTNFVEEELEVVEEPKAVEFESTKLQNAQYWPKPAALIDAVQKLGESPVTAQWSQQGLETLNYLHERPDLNEATLRAVFEDLEKKRQLLPRVYEEIWREDASRVGVDKNELMMQLRLVDHQLARRLTIWNSALAVATGSRENTNRETGFLQASNGRARFDVHPDWNEYLTLPDAESVFNALNSKAREEKLAARKVLARAYNPALTAVQSNFVLSSMSTDMAKFFKSKASEEGDVFDLLNAVEDHELAGTGYTQYRLNDEYQNLLWSDDQASQKLASQLDTYYRNANFRLAVSSRLANRMVPQMPETAEPISDRLQGARIFGQNRIRNEFEVQFIPDPSQINLQIVTDGEVLSTTFAEKSGFRVENVGTARFRILKQLAFARDGVSSPSPIAASTANQQMVGVSSNLDNIPLVGWMARRIAKRKVESDSPQTEQIYRQKVETSASERVQEEVENGLAKVRSYLFHNLYQPLVAMDLEPDPLEMSTSENEIVMRYRLAGRDQMAANSARPMPPNDSLLNAQVHQSAINNLLLRADLKGKKFSIQELSAHLKERLGMQIATDESSKHEAELVFAPFDPLRVDFEDDRIRFCLNLKSFKVGKKGKRWRNVSVKATYIPKVQGQQILLVQEDALRIKGKGFKLRDQIAVRTILEALLQKSYTVSPLPAKLLEKLRSPNLAINQFVVHNGWLGISINDGFNQQPAMSRGPARLLRRRR